MADEDQPDASALPRVRREEEPETQIDEEQPDESYRWQDEEEDDDLLKQDSDSRSVRIREKLKRWCFPQSILVVQTVPLLFCAVALSLSGAGFWHCSYFHGATISFTGDMYGIWTLADSTGRCQLWDVLFFAYDLGWPLFAARVFSFTVLLFGLALFATMTQARQFYAISWGLGLALVILFFVSVTTTSIYNVWIVFWLFTYVLFILIVRALFIHPVHRRISARGTKIIVFCLFLCGVCCSLTLLVLKSDFCTCSNISSERFHGRAPGDPCQGTCQMGAAGYLSVVASFFWFVSSAATLKFGIQPEELPVNESAHMYAYYRQSSIFTRVAKTKAITVKRFSLRARKSDNEGDSQVHEGTGDAQETNESDLCADSQSTSDINQSATEMNESFAAQSDNNDDGSNGDQPDTRPCCSKLCCDYRTTKRSRKERWVFWTFRVMLGLLMVFYIFLIVILVGSRVENTTAAKAPDTTSFFVTDKVCAFDPLDPFQPFETFPTKDDANNTGYSVAHCGVCGVCSNPADIETYVTTRKTIAKLSKQCSTKAVFGRYDGLVDCLEGKLGLSRECTKCWASNMRTTARKCLFTCMVTLFTGFMSDNNVPGAGDQGWLNQCVFCDERLSGPAFVTCSGAARRRLGIVSEIERSPEEQCKNADIDWDDVDYDTVFPAESE